jgi:hypothetical protein
MNRNNTWLVTLLTLALIAITGSAAPASDFDDLLKNPKVFNGRRVTLVGLAEIGGSEFFLYPDVQSAKRGENAIFVDAHILNENPYEKLNNHWLRITGIVDTGTRPPLGFGTCSVSLERVEPLASPQLADSDVKGVFKNDTTITVDVKFSTPTGDGYIVNLPPGQISKPSTISAGSVAVTAKSGESVAQADVVIRPPPNQYFDSGNRTYYYRIRHGSITPVVAREASKWRNQSR